MTSGITKPKVPCGGIGLRGQVVGLVKTKLGPIDMAYCPECSATVRLTTKGVILRHSYGTDYQGRG